MVDRSLGTGAVGGVCGNCMVIGSPGGGVCDLWDVGGMAILGGRCGGVAVGPRGGWGEGHLQRGYHGDGQGCYRWWWW